MLNYCVNYLSKEKFAIELHVVDMGGVFDSKNAYML